MILGILLGVIYDDFQCFLHHFFEYAFCIDFSLIFGMDFGRANLVFLQTVHLESLFSVSEFF